MGCAAQNFVLYGRCKPLFAQIVLHQFCAERKVGTRLFLRRLCAFRFLRRNSYLLYQNKKIAESEQIEVTVAGGMGG